MQDSATLTYTGSSGSNTQCKEVLDALDPIANTETVGLSVIDLGIGNSDTEKDGNYLADKIAYLRIFPDDAGAMNRSVLDIQGQALVISQFTLFGDVRKGRRPSFISAMVPEKAEPLYRQFIAQLTSMGVPCGQGRFGAMMDIESVNDGPVTILLDSQKIF